jgi:hypothetical protein
VRCRLQVRTTEWLAYCHFHFGQHDKVRGRRPGAAGHRRGQPRCWRQQAQQARGLASRGSAKLPLRVWCACGGGWPTPGMWPRRSLQALRLYRELLAGGDPDPMYYLYCSACLYYMGLYKEAEAEAAQVSWRKPRGIGGRGGGGGGGDGGAVPARLGPWHGPPGACLQAWSRVAGPGGVGAAGAGC